MTVGERIKEYREANKLTMKQFSEALKVGFSNIYIWESGKSKPSFIPYCRMLELFKVKHEDFMKGVDIDA